LRAGGRWHTAGRAVVYTAEHPALALVEAIVHLELDSVSGVPAHYQLLEIDVPEKSPREIVKAPLLGGKWANEITRTRAIGDRWLREGRTALLVVPSTVVPNSQNWLINPAHADAARLRIVGVTKYPFDVRLVRGNVSRSRPRSECLRGDQPGLGAC